MTGNTDILRANLAQLRKMEPELCDRIENTTPAALTWSESKSGPLTATIEHDGRPIALASKYDPAGEAEKLISSIDATKHGAAVIMGLGLGYHVAQAAELLGSEKSLLIVHESDISLMRAVFERIDHTAWLSQANLVLADDQLDRAALLSRIERFGSIMTQGTALITHPTARRLSESSVANFSEMVTDALAFMRTNIATTLVNSSRTIRNLTTNMPYYVGGDTTNDIYQVAQGYPAVCVSAGPSLAKNVHLLKNPEIRRNVIVISVQTTLKPLLDHGIRPDFVTALDYHEISKRFYEGLPRLDGENPVTLVAEPKANKSILDNFPGPVRVTASQFADRLLGPHARPIMPIQPGATVAHLSFYLAQHLGCDPIIFIGQDLGFSNGLYYCPGTAIHDVWAPELNQFNTLEMMEWQRIVRHRGHLQRQEDINGQPIFTDEQMVTYLKQFERDFARSSQTIIDATEGGLPKEHTQRTTLQDALDQYATRPIPNLPQANSTLDPSRLEMLEDLLETRLHETQQIRKLSQATIPLLKQMKQHQRDFKKANKIYAQIEKNKKRVEQYKEIFSLINDLNTIGSFKRARADRAIHHSKGNQFEQQVAQLDRDLVNLDWLIQACDEAIQIFHEGLQRVQQFRKRALQSAA